MNLYTMCKNNIVALYDERGLFLTDSILIYAKNKIILAAMRKWFKDNE